MYLLEAKKRAEKEFKEKQKKEAKEAREAARRQRYAHKKEQKEQKAAAKSGRSASTAADDAARRRQQEEAARKAKEEADLQEAMRRSKEDARQREIRDMRSALQQDAPRVIQSQPQHDMVVQPLPSDNEDGVEWTDMSIKCFYVGTFEVGNSDRVDKAQVKKGIHSMKDFISGERDAILIICLEGLKVIDNTSNKVAMAHALNRVSIAVSDPELPLFGFVAKNPGKPTKFCHVFHFRSRKNSEHVQGLVMKAFRMAYSHRRQSQTGAQLEKAAASAVAAAKRDPAPKPTKAAAPPRGGPPQQHQQRVVRERRGDRNWAKHNPLPGAGGVGIARGQASRPTVAPVRRQGQPARAPQSAAPAAAPPPAAAAAKAKKKVEKKPAKKSEGTPTPTPAEASTSPIPAASSPTSAPVTSLESAAWFQAGIPREIAMELLDKEDEGSFVVRESSSQPGNYALTMKGGGLMHHFIIRKVPNGYILGSEDQNQMLYNDLGSLIIAYAKSPGCLPVCLNLDSFNSVYEEDDGADDTENNASFVDPDYQDMVDLMGRL